MPTVDFEGRRIECPEGKLLRDVLLAAGETPHNGRARRLNCRGHGTCGTCAVELADLDGEDPAVNEPTSREKRRLSFPPHSLDTGLRLACQTRVYGDLVVSKHEGFWGQHVDGE
jgi:ferredoxin